MPTILGPTFHGLTFQEPIFHEHAVFGVCLLESNDMLLRRWIATAKMDSCFPVLLISGWVFQASTWFSYPGVTNKLPLLRYFSVKGSEYFCFTDWTWTDAAVNILLHWYFYILWKYYCENDDWHCTLMRNQVYSLYLLIFRQPAPSLHCLKPRAERKLQKYYSIVIMDAWE